MSRVELPVQSPSWRSWPAKDLLEDWPGVRRVEILDAGGNRFEVLGFELR